MVLRMFYPLCLILIFGLTWPWSDAYEVTTDYPNVSVPENGAVDLSCKYTGDFGSPRVVWKFRDESGSHALVYFDKKFTENYKERADFSSKGIHLRTTTRADTGKYTCEVSQGSRYSEVTVQLTIEVPPSVPSCEIPTSVTNGATVKLTCFEPDGSPPSTYSWYKDDVLVPDDPKKAPAFVNSSFTNDRKIGVLTFSSVTHGDSGEYFCQAANGIGESQFCTAVRMEVSDVNVGGIVAAVIIVVLILALLGLGLWYAYRKGYIQKKIASKPKAIYKQPPVDETDDVSHKLN
uniref:Junctional adhesion molecule A n=1 Tax=Latimeria chalumnae TaxID=7897 RepID=H2ZUL0_LATCH